ncbi:MAG: 50S ribosomal protein L29 [SAR202 cluster bacterium]|nr:50S ribosomal protein L29 [SAR202 cluster bacterium]
MRSKVDTVRALDDAKLREEEQNTQQELLNLRIKLSTRQLANPNELAKTRRKLAQIKTVARERQLAGGK